MKYRIRERVNDAGYRWVYVQERHLFWWGLPNACALQQAHFTTSGGRVSYREFKTLESAKEAIQKVRQIKPYIKTVYEE